MLLAFSSLLRWHRHSSVRQQLTGAVLQANVDYTYFDAANSDGGEDVSSSIRASSSAAASTSASSCTPTPLFASGLNESCFTLTARHASNASESHSARRREILRDASQKVSPGSTWLLAYSHNINPRQLTYRLGKRSTLHALEEGWALYQPKFDTVAMAALLRRVRVAQLYDPDYNAAAAQRLLDALEPRLRSITMRFGKLRDTTAYLHALAKLQSPPPQAPAPGIAGLVDNEQESAVDAEFRKGLALVSQPAELVLDLAMWATRDRDQVKSASPRRLATLLWALLRTVPDELYSSEKLQMVLDRVALCSIRQWPNFSAQDMQLYAIAYATFGPRAVPVAASTLDPHASWDQSDRSWMGTVSPWTKPAKKADADGYSEGRASAGANGLQSGDGRPSADAGVERGFSISNDSSAKLKVVQRQKRNALVLQVMSDKLVKRVGDVTVAQPHARDLVLVAHAWALQAAPTPHMPLLVKAADAAASAPRSLLPEELVMLTEALAQFGVRQPVLLDAVRECARDWSSAVETPKTVAANESVPQRSLAEMEEQRLKRLYGQLVKAYGRLGIKL